MNKKSLSERDICTKFINPAIEGAGWHMKRQVREEVTFTDRCIIMQGKIHTRGKRKRGGLHLAIKKAISSASVPGGLNKSLTPPAATAPR